MYTLKTLIDIKEYLKHNPFSDFQRENIYYAFEIEEAKDIVNYFRELNCVIIGITLLENKEDAGIDIAYAWWNFEHTKLENSSVDSCQEALVYLQSDFISDSKVTRYVEIGAENINDYIEKVEFGYYDRNGDKVQEYKLFKESMIKEGG